MVRARASHGGAGNPGEPMPAGGDHLAESLHHGARAIRRGGRRAPLTSLWRYTGLAAIVGSLRSVLARAVGAPRLVRLCLSGTSVTHSEMGVAGIERAIAAR